MEPERVSRDVDSINSLDTAKMTLRWALERIRTLEEKKAVLEAQAHEAHSALTHQIHAFREREAYISDREQHYKKLESLMVDYCRGTLDLRQLLAREAEAERKGLETDQRRADLEREFAERKDRLERDFKKLQAELEILSAHQAESVEHAMNERKVHLDKAYVARELAIRSAEHNLEVREKAVKELEARQDLSLHSRHETMERQYRQLEADLRSELERRLGDWERQRSSQEDLRARHWATERQALDQQARSWEAQAREHLAKIQKLEAEKAEAQESLVRGELDTGERLRAVEEEYRAKDKALRLQVGELRDEMKAALADSEAKHAVQLSEVHGQLEAARHETLSRTRDVEEERHKADDLASKLAAAEERLRGVSEALAAERARSQQWASTAESVQAESASRVEAHARREAESSRAHEERAAALLRDLKAKEAALDAAWAARKHELELDFSRRRDELEAAVRSRETSVEEELRSRHDSQVTDLRSRLELAERNTSVLEEALAAERTKVQEWMAAAGAARGEQVSIQETHLSRESALAGEYRRRLQASAEQEAARAAEADADAAQRLAALRAELEEKVRREAGEREAAARDEAAAKLAAAEERLRELDEDFRAQRAKLQEWTSAASAAQAELAALKEQGLRAETDRAKEREEWAAALLRDFKEKEAQLAEAHRQRAAEAEESFGRRLSGLEERLRQESLSREAQSADDSAKRLSVAEWRVRALEASLNSERAKASEWMAAAETARSELGALKEASLEREWSRRSEELARREAALREPPAPAPAPGPQALNAPEPRGFWKRLFG